MNTIASAERRLFWSRDPRHILLMCYAACRTDPATQAFAGIISRAWCRNLRNKICQVVLFVIASAISGSAAAEDLLVSAAASLTSAFQEIGRAFEQSRSGTKVAFSFGASGHNLQQLAQGAPIDVFATADAETMDRAAQQGWVAPQSRANFAGNRLVLVIASGASNNVAGMRDLASPAVKRIAFANPVSAPFARHAKQALESTGLWDAVSPKLVFADTVRQDLAYVARGEADAAFVYATDAAIEKDRIRVVAEIPTGTPIVYPVARVAGTRNTKQADEFIAFLLSATGQQILLRHGFSKL